MWKIFLLFALGRAVVSTNATFTSNPQNVYGKVGDTLSLSCEATGASAKVIEWYKDSTKISNGVSTSTANGVTTSSLTLMNVQLSDGSANYYCKAGPTAGHQDAVSSSKAIVGILGSITSFSSRSFHPGSSSNRPFACTFTANPRPTSGELILDGKVEASLTQTIPNSGNSWTVSDPIQSITVEEGGNYTCVAKMGSFSIVSYAQLGITCVISVPPQATLLEAGKTKTLTCSGTGYPIPSITWKKTLGSQVNQIAGKDSTDYSKREKTSSITLMGSDIDQAGSYECTVTNTAPGSIIRTSSVDVTVKPMIVTKSFARTGTWGQSEILTCLAIGYPLPTITWTFRGQPVTKGVSDSAAGSVNRTSTLTRMTVEALKDGGVYTCNSTNSIGNGGSIDVTLNFFPMITTSPIDKTVNHGQDTTLTCSGNGYPVSTITWTSPTGSSFTAKNPTVASGIATRIIDVTNQKGADGGGTFKCTASNGIGNDASAQAIISVRPKVTKVVPSTRSVVDGSTVDPVVCETEGYPKPSVNWKLKGSTVSSSLTTNEYSVGGLSYRSGRNLTLGAVSFSQNGNVYTCEASNSAGSSTSTFILTVTVDATFTSDPQNKYGKVGDTLSLSCEATGSSAKVIEWYKDSTKISNGVSTSTANGVTTSSLTLMNVQLSDASANYYCKAGPTAGHQDAVSSSKAIVGILGSITSFSSRSFHPGSSSSRPFACTFTANPRPTSGELILDGKVEASLTQTIPNSGNSWTVSDPIQSITVEEGGNYTCVAKMDSFSIVSYAQLGITCVISVPPQPTLLEAGKTKTLTCSGTGYPIPSITWKKTLGSQVNQIAGKDSTDYSKREKTSSITLMGSDIDQAGSYECTVTNTAPGSIIRTSSVDVTVKPMIVTKSFSQTGTWGQSEMLTCTVTGYPLPTITWTFRGQPVTKDVSVSTAGSVNRTSTLTRTAVKALKDGGVYTCNSTNSAGNGGSIDVTLNLLPKVTKLDPSTRSVVNGSTVDPIVCEAEGYPKPSVNWKLGGRIVLDSLTTDEYGVGGFSYSTGRNLTLGAVALSQNGNVYTCEASNSAGSDTSMFTLTVTVDAKITSSPHNVYGKVGDTLSLSCEATGASLIEWYKDSTNISNGVSTSTANGVITSSLTLTSVQLSDGSANYYCKAGPTADHQEAVSSSDATVGILGSITSFFSRSFHPGSSSNRPFFCTFTANPRPTSGELILDGKVEASLTQTTPNSGNSWTVSDPIQSITVEEGGNYTCVAKMGSFSIVSYAQLGITCVISVPPQATLLEAGKTKTLICSGTGYPIPSITWKKTLGSQVNQIAGKDSTDYSKREKTSSITLMGSDIDQAGSYECTVTNTAPGSIIRTSSVDVTVKPMIVTKSFARTGTWGQSEVLTCLAIGYPLPTITWTFRGQPVTKGVSDSAAGSVNRTSTLTRMTVEALKDGGVYMCNSTNSIGNGGSIDVTLNFNPRVTTDPQSQEVAYGGAFSLTCVISSYPAVSSPIQWSKDGIIRSSSSPVGVPNKPTDVASTYTINAVNENDGGNYSCFGLSNPAIITIGNFFNLNPQGGNPIEGNSAQLSCKVVGYPPHNIIWEQSNDDKSYTTVSLGFRSQKTERSISSNLTFSAIDRSNSGYYRCRTDGANQVISIAAHIDVYYLPSFSVDLDGLIRTVRTGASFTLTCTAMGNPLPTVDFYKTSLDSSATTTVVSADADHQITVTNGKATWVVSNATTSDSGKYFCRASNVAGHVNSSYSVLAVPGPPSRIDPAQVTVSGKTDSSITFAWTTPYDGNSPILNYTISYKLDSSPDINYKVYRVVDKGTKAVTLSGLKAFTDYAIRIVASNVEGPAEGTTAPKIIKTATGVPTSPLNFVVTVQSSASVSVTWDSPSEPRGVIQNYRVFYENKGSGRSKRAPKQKQFSGISTSGTISGLEKFTRYDLYVVAVNTLNSRDLVSPQSNVVSVTTEEDAPSAPRNVRGEIVVDSSSMLRVVWDEPVEANGIIRNYFIFYGKKDAGGTILTKEVNGSKTSETLENLDSYTFYTIQVQAYTIKNGPPSTLVEARTGEGIPSAPLNLTVASSSPTSVSLRWEQPETPRGIISQYTVFYKERNLCIEKDEVSEVVNPPRTEYTAQHLNPNTKWTFSVAASTTAGRGNRSAVVVAKTPPNDIVTATSTTYDSLYAGLSTSTTSTRDLSSGCNYVGVAVGCTCGGLAGGLIVALIVYIWMKRKLEKSLQSSVDAGIKMTSSPLYDTMGRGETKDITKGETVYEEMTGFGSEKGVKKEEEESAYQSLDTVL
ncbi:hemicentin-1-like [Oscarella lobularis]|uniref:hemicentin-1-like n=1 Tax=Oscarella lobularis TaxID=121494 RepID=UPI003313CE51